VRYSWGVGLGMGDIRGVGCDSGIGSD
jgi:hypothetical protein